MEAPTIPYCIHHVTMSSSSKHHHKHNYSLRYRPARLDLHERVSVDRPLKSHQPLYVFDFSILVLNKTSKFAASHKNVSNLVGRKPRSCPPNRAPKMPESQQLFCRLRLVSRIFENFQHSQSKSK
jgi:hypothetical protein